VDCQFEEKEFEQPLNIELGCKGKVFPAGQFLEGQIGIDAAIFSTNGHFWLLWNKTMRPKYRSGVFLSSGLWDFVKQRIDDKRFPKFKCNLFLQHKRPTFIKRSNGLWYDDWKQPYFKYAIERHQQETLFKLEQKVSSDAIVVYSCPSFWESEELWEHVAKFELVENTNFARPYDLGGHDVYTFVKGGIHGKAFSEEPAQIRCVNLLREVEQRREKEPPFARNTDFIFALSKSIQEVVKESRETFREGYSKIIDSLDIPEQELARSVAHILVFTFMTSVSWNICY